MTIKNPAWKFRDGQTRMVNNGSITCVKNPLDQRHERDRDAVFMAESFYPDYEGKPKEFQTYDGAEFWLWAVHEKQRSAGTPSGVLNEDVPSVWAME